jgi:hypothetical protein
MRYQHWSVLCASVIIATSLATAANAADQSSGVTVVYGHPPIDPLLPPVGYVIDPSDARRPIYVVNQGPVYSGPGIISIAVPTYSEGGYAYALPYPYVRGYGWYDAPGYRHWPRPYAYGPNVIRPYAAAYRYRLAPNARVINVPQR